MGVKIHLVSRVDMIVAAVLFLVIMFMEVTVHDIVVPMFVGVGVSVDVVMNEIAMHMFMAVYMTVLVRMHLFDRFCHSLFLFE